MITDSELYKMVCNISCIDRGMILYNLFKRQEISEHQYRLFKDHMRELRDNVL